MDMMLRASARRGLNYPAPYRLLDAISPASPEAAAGGGLALLETGDRVRVDLNTGRADALVDPAVWDERRRRLEAAGGFSFPASQTPWQDIQRRCVGQLAEGMILEGAEQYQRIAQTRGIPRDSH